MSLAEPAATDRPSISELCSASFRLFLFAIVIALLVLCSLWKKRHALFCAGWSTSSSHRVPSEGDSAGSCYAPPHYSRCSSFYHAPPPYTEVTSKPDLYPLVFSYLNDGSKNDNNGANYLMVQYFRNYIVRPIGSLSATSTVDSLASSFICTANEANTMIPPPYSSAASPDALSISLQNYAMPRSASQTGCALNAAKTPVTAQFHVENASPNTPRPMSVPNTNQTLLGSHQFRTSESANFADFFRRDEASNHQNPTSSSSTVTTTRTGSSRSKTRNTVSDDDDDDFQQANSLGNTASGINFDDANQSSSIYHSNDTMLSLSAAMMDKISYSRQTNDHTKLNMIQKQLEKCCEMIQQQQKQIQQTRSHFNVTNFDSESSISGEPGKKLSDGAIMQLSYSMNSNTASTVSSLANLNSPGSPPQATSPTQEVKNLLEQINQLKDSSFSIEELNMEPETSRSAMMNDSLPGPSTEPTGPVRSSVKRPTTLNSRRRFFNMNRSVYLPIASGSNAFNAKLQSPTAVHAASFMSKPRSVRNRSGWMSKSAPTTPGTGLPSNFVTDNSPLLDEQDEDSDADQNC